jgi:hypothetical protein
MKFRSVHRFSWLLGLALVLPAASVMVAGCGSEAPAPPAEHTGTLSAALSTTGPDGATYKFLNGTRLQVATPQWMTSFPVDGPEAVFTKQLAVGSYTLELTTWTVLERTYNGVSKIVQAEWLDPHPIPFSILENQTTPVVLHFRVTGLGDITFAVGNLAVTVEVENATTTNATRAREDGTFTVNSQTFADPAAPYAAPLTVDPAVTHFQGIGVNATGPWEHRFGTMVCRPVSVAAISNSTGDDPVQRRLFQILVGGAGELCIADQGAQDSFTLNLVAEGAVPGDQTAYLPEPSYFRNIFVSGSIGDVFDGATLRQTVLAEGVPVSSGQFMHLLISNTTGTQLTRLDGSFSGGTFALEP